MEPEKLLAEISRLTAAGTLGFFTHFEATEIIAFPTKDSDPINVFTILIAEERVDTALETPHFLNASRIKVPGLRDWAFGVYRYTGTIDQLALYLEKSSATGKWEASGNILRHAAQAARAPQFVPPDTYQGVPWNRVLKNNFWNGSYILEWVDPGKSTLKPLFEEPRRLQSLSDAVGAHVPIEIASLTDRLGNIILQLPVTVLMARFNGLHDGSLMVETGWHPKATPRPLRANVEMEFDGTVTGFNSLAVESEFTVVPALSGPGTHRGILWDETNKLILAATGPSAFIRTIGLNLCPIASEPRVFTLPDENGEQHEHRVRVHHNQKSIVGAPETDENGGWTQKRMYRTETSRLVSERRFAQYRPQLARQNAEHLKALNDIRQLIAQYGEEGAWLWDPYLSAADILRTLFFCPHSGADLRGLTAMADAPEIRSAST